MPFNSRSRLDTTQVDDRRRSRVTGTRVAVGGGGIGLVILVIALLLGVNPSDLADLSMQAPSTSYEGTTSEASSLAEECRTGADANEREDCRIVGFVNSIQAYWTDAFASQGAEYTPARTVLYSGAVSGACGYASSAVGPFYCPRDQQVYLDISFFEDLQNRYGARGGAYAEAYVLAHEYGHHIQDLAGVLDPQSMAGDSGPQSMSVMTELQADCLAGVWLNHATETGYLTPMTDAEVAQSLDAASAVGDDRIQSMTQGYVSPESWTHGSSEQRRRALMAGMQSGDISACDGY